jgi:Tol biopolymer transport system component
VPTDLFGPIHLVQQCRWSPDGRRIAFTRTSLVASDLSAWSDLFVINRDGSGLRQLTTSTRGRFIVAPSWSPDGTAIAFGFETGSDPTRVARSDLFVKVLDRDGFVQLTSDGRSRQPAW